MLHGRSRRVWLGAGVALIAAAWGCSQGEPAPGAAVERECAGFEPLAVQITAESFEPDWKPYVLWVRNRRETCSFVARITPGAQIADGGTCVMSIRAGPSSARWDKGLRVETKFLSGPCRGIGKNMLMFAPPPEGAIPVGGRSGDLPPGVEQGQSNG